IVRLDDESLVTGPVETDTGDHAHSSAETTPAESDGEGSAWPSYVVGGGLVAAGAALWISPVMTLAGSGDLKSIDGAEEVERVAIDGGQVALMVAGSVLAVAGVTLMVGGWLRTSANVSSDGASLNLEGQF
ncbi:MAG: hypothetical protein AB8H86_08540, partial [Polyangiales bacterium]